MKLFLILLLISASAFGKPCGPEGDAKSAAERAQNPLKNRIAAPTAVSRKITLQTILAPGNDVSRFTAKQAATVTGYVAVVKPGGLESCECHDPTLLDTHIALVATPASYGNSRKYVIVEVTWHFRNQIGSTAALKAKLLHKRVSVTGWLFFDGSHKANAVNTNPKGKHNWRATCWELHPAVAITTL